MQRLSCLLQNEEPIVAYAIIQQLVIAKNQKSPEEILSLLRSKKDPLLYDQFNDLIESF